MTSPRQSLQPIDDRIRNAWPNETSVSFKGVVQHTRMRAKEIHAWEVDPSIHPSIRFHWGHWMRLESFWGGWFTRTSLATKRWAFSAKSCLLIKNMFSRSLCVSVLRPFGFLRTRRGWFQRGAKVRTEPPWRRRDEKCLQRWILVWQLEVNQIPKSPLSTVDLATYGPTNIVRPLFLSFFLHPRPWTRKVNGTTTWKPYLQGVNYLACSHIKGFGPCLSHYSLTRISHRSQQSFFQLPFQPIRLITSDSDG